MWCEQHEVIDPIYQHGSLQVVGGLIMYVGWVYISWVMSVSPLKLIIDWGLLHAHFFFKPFQGNKATNPLSVKEYKKILRSKNNKRSLNM